MVRSTLILALSLSVTAVHAAPPPPSAELCARLQDGQWLRVLTPAGELLEAPFAGCRGDTLLRFVETRARALGMDDLFVLSTRTAHWFRERGFQHAGVDRLPRKRRPIPDPSHLPSRRPGFPSVPRHLPDVQDHDDGHEQQQDEAQLRDGLYVRGIGDQTRADRTGDDARHQECGDLGDAQAGEDDGEYASQDQAEADVPDQGRQFAAAGQGGGRKQAEQ